MTNGQRAKGAMRGFLPVIVALAVLATSAGVEVAVLGAREPDATDIPVIETARPMFVAPAVAITATTQPSALTTPQPPASVSPTPPSIVPRPATRPSPTPPASTDEQDTESDTDDDDREVVSPPVREEAGEGDESANDATDADNDREVVSPPVREEDGDREDDPSGETLNGVQKRESSSRTHKGAKDD